MKEAKSAQGIRYDETDQKRIIQYVARHGLSDEKLAQMKKELNLAYVPSAVTIRTRWLHTLPAETVLEWLSEVKEADSAEYLSAGIGEQWEKRLHRKDEVKQITFQDYYRCFHAAKKADHATNGNEKVKCCDSYSQFLDYLLLDNLIDTSQTLDAFKRMLRCSPAGEKIQNIFGDRMVLNKEKRDLINELIIDDFSDLQRDKLTEAFEISIDQNSLLGDVTKEYLQTMLRIFRQTGQANTLASIATALLSVIIWGTDEMISKALLDPELTALIHKTGIPMENVNEILKIILTEGLSGRMGTHHLMHFATRPRAVNPIAAMEIGDRYYDGLLSETHDRSMDEAYAYYELAAEMNHAYGMWSCGYMLMRNMGKKAQSYPTEEERFQKAREYFERGAELGSPACINALGQLYLRGQALDENGAFLPRNLDEAERYLTKSIDMGYFYSHNALAQVYEIRAKEAEEMGDSSKARLEYGKATLHYKEAAVFSDGYSRNKLGQFLEKGLGRKKDNDKAAMAYLHALDVLDADKENWSYVNVARVYSGNLENNVREIDHLQACVYYEKACQKIAIEAQASFIVDYLHSAVLLAQSPEGEEHWFLLHDTLAHAKRFLDHDFKGRNAERKLLDVKRAHDKLKKWLYSKKK